MDETPIFRANKRRKFVRQKEQHAEPKIVADDQVSDQDDHDVENDRVDISTLVKTRKQARSRATGVLFSQQKRSQSEDEPTNMVALTKVDPEEEKLREISNRFIGSTGQVVDDDKHMMAYIDSEMARRHHIASQDHDHQPIQRTDNDTLELPNPTQSKDPLKLPSQAQISEFDLGPDAYQKNIARTEAAIARVQSGIPPPIEDLKPRRPRKPRLGRDGKPLVPRPRKRRNSEDIARDALVEQLLHERRMDVYDGELQVETSTNEDADADADKRLAEHFRQEFMDAMAERQQKNQVKAATAAKAKGVGPDQSGPKLGGSRSARAKMALMQQQSQLPKAAGQK